MNAMSVSDLQRILQKLNITDEYPSLSHSLLISSLAFTVYMCTFFILLVHCYLPLFFCLLHMLH